MVDISRVDIFKTCFDSNVPSFHVWWSASWGLLQWWQEMFHWGAPSEAPPALRSWPHYRWPWNHWPSVGGEEQQCKNGLTSLSRCNTFDANPKNWLSDNFVHIDWLNKIKINLRCTLLSDRVALSWRVWPSAEPWFCWTGTTLWCTRQAALSLHLYFLQKQKGNKDYTDGCFRVQTHRYVL